MPSLSRRRDAVDSRSDRLESHIRFGEMAKDTLINRGELPQCANCKRVFEEKSKHCPFCDRKTMGLIKPIPEKHLDEARRKALREARERIGL